MFNRTLSATVIAALLGAIVLVMAASSSAAADKGGVRVSVSLQSPSPGANAGSRPRFAGTARGTRTVRISLWKGASNGRPDEVLTTRRRGRSFSVRPRSKLEQGRYIARAGTPSRTSRGSGGRIRFRVKRSDRKAPETEIVSGPSGTINTDTATFAFSSNEPGIFQCKFDGSSWSKCSNPTTYTNLANGTHALEVRARDEAGNRDQTPAKRSFAVAIDGGGSEPPVDPPAVEPGVIPGTGAVLKQDLATNPDPVPLWRKIESAYPEQDASNQQVVHRTGDGDPRPAVGQSAPSEGYRRLFTTSGMQSLYDAGVGNNRQRTQLVSNSNTNLFHPLDPSGRYVIYFSVRFEESTSIPNDSLGDDSQIWQIKNTGNGPAGTRDLIIAMQEARSELHFTHMIDGEHTVLWEGGFTRGVWTRFALDIRTSPNPGQGSLQLWGNPSGDPRAALVPLTDKVTLQTAYDPEAIGKFSVGPYHRLTSGGVSRDYANIQICDWIAP